MTIRIVVLYSFIVNTIFVVCCIVTCHVVLVYNNYNMDKSNDKKIVKHSGGRPLKITEEVVRELVELLRVGATIEQACDYAGIGKQTFYDRLKADKEFVRKMAQAQTYIAISAKRNVANDIVADHSIDTSKWLLEKTEYRTREGIAFEDKDVRFIVTRG